MSSSKEVELAEKTSHSSNAPERSDSMSQRARLKRANKGGGFGTDRSLVHKRKDYKVFCAGLSLCDLGITFCLLMTLYGIVTGMFTGFMLWIQNTQLSSLNNDYALWICFGFGLSYWTIVAIMVATGTRAQFDAAVDEKDV